MILRISRSETKNWPAQHEQSAKYKFRCTQYVNSLKHFFKTRVLESGRFLFWRYIFCTFSKTCFVFTNRSLLYHPLPTNEKNVGREKVLGVPLTFYIMLKETFISGMFISYLYLFLYRLFVFIPLNGSLMMSVFMLRLCPVKYSIL